MGDATAGSSVPPEPAPGASVSHRCEVFADYHQFYLWDPSVDPQAPEEYSEEDVAKRVKVAPNVVVVQPARNMDVPVELLVYRAPPALDPDGWDHIVVCGLELPSGRLHLEECTGGTVLEEQLAPGAYTVRVLFWGLDTLSADGLDGRDLYRIELWPGGQDDLDVVKRST